MESHHLLITFSALVFTALALSPQSGVSDIFRPQNPNPYDSGLRAVLSSAATISHQVASAPRWSEYHAPQPGTIVNVATERDVQAAVGHMFTSNHQ